MPLDYNQASWLVAEECDIRGRFPYNALKLGSHYAEEYMRDFVQAVNGKVYPYLTENGSLEGYFELCRRRSNAHPNGIGDVNELYRQAATAIVLRRPEDARTALDGVRQVIDSEADDREWVRALYNQAGILRDRLCADPAAVREELLAGVDEQKRRRNLPLDR
jgi:hypothetical protein